MMVYIRLVLTAFLWGGTFVAGRMLADMGPFTAAFLRFTTATFCLLWLIRRHEGGMPSLSKREWFGVTLLGATGVFAYNYCFFTGLQTIPAGRASVIIANNPVLIALFAALFFGETLTKKKLIGIAISVSGAITAISNGNPLALFGEALTTGDFFIFGAVASWVSYSLLGKRMMNNLSPHAAVTCSCITGALMLLPFALANGMVQEIAAITLQQVLAILYVGILGTVVGFTWFYQGVKELGAGRAGVFINFVPVTAIICGWLILGEPVPASLLMGGLMVVAGVYLTNRG